jgi:regulatory protein
MMKITKITRQVKHPERYSIFVDDEYAFSLGETELLNQKLFGGQAIDSHQLEVLKKLSVDDKTFSNVLRYAAIRPHSIWELQSYLERKRVTEGTTKKILEKLSSAGLADDEAFARIWIENRQLLRPSSKRRLVQELRKKHIDEQIIQRTLVECQIDDTVTISELIKKRRLAKYHHDRLKLMQYLTRQGFDYTDIKTVLSGESDDIAK